MKAGTAQKISNAILSCLAGFASFLFSLAGLLYLTEFDQKILAALVAGAFCLLVSYIASERPNSESSRALAALRDPVAGGRGWRPHFSGTSCRTADHAQARRRGGQPVHRSAVLDRNAHALGMYDPVTSLPNRLHFRSEADKMLGDGPATGQSAMLFVDLDRFKMVNDSLGHARGDQLLIMVANRLRVVVNAELPGSAPRASAASAARWRRIHRCSSRRSRPSRRSNASHAEWYSLFPSPSSFPPAASISAPRRALPSRRIMERALKR